jgi:hypothetical protein
MSAYTNGLRELADYLDHHPNVPQPDFPGPILVFTPSNLPDDAALNEVVRIAATFGTDVLMRGDGRHRLAHKAFGPVDYQLVSITARRAPLDAALVGEPSGSTSAVTTAKDVA